MNKKRTEIPKKIKDKLQKDSCGFCMLFFLKNDDCSDIIYNTYKNIDSGEVAHICAVSEGGARFDKDIEDVHDIDNLIFICRACHNRIDRNPDKFSVSILQNYKKDFFVNLDKRIKSSETEIDINYKIVKKLIINILNVNKSIDDLYKSSNSILEIDKKLSKNDLTTGVKNYFLKSVNFFSYIEECIGELENEYVDSSANDFSISKQIESIIVKHYKDLAVQYKGNTLFNKLYDRIVLECKAKQDEKDMCNALICYYFEKCRIFKK